MLLRRALLRELKRGKWSLAAALVGLSVAVASVSSVHLLNARVERNLEALQPFDLPATIARRETGGNISLADYANLQDQLAKGQAPRVEALIALIEGPVGEGWRILGVDWVAMLGRRGSRVSDGEIDMTRLLTERSVLVPEGASASHLSVIEQHGLLALGTHGAADDRLLVADIATASEILGQAPISALALVLEQEAPGLLELLDKLFVGLSAARIDRVDQGLLGEGYVISTPDEEFPVRRFARSIMFNLGVLSALCLLVAGFIAYQSAAGMALRRAPLLNRLRSLGAPLSAISSYEYRESAALGVLACLIGLPLGLALALLVLELGGLGEPDLSTFDVWLLIKGVLVGVGVSLLGTMLARPRADGRQVGVSIRTGALCLALTAIALGAFLDLPGAFLILGGAFVLVAQVAWLALKWVSHLKFPGLSLSARQVIRGACRQGQRLYPVISAFILALSVALAMQLMVASLKRDFDAFLDLRLDGDVSVQSGSEGLSESIIAPVSELPGVESVRIAEVARARIGALSAEVRLIDYSSEELARYGAASDTPVDQVLINSQLARQAQDPVDVQVTGTKGQAPSRVAHVFNDLGAAGPRLVMSRRLGETLFVDTQIDALRIHVAPDEAAAVRAQIEADFGLATESTARLRERAMRTLDETFWVSDALSTVALLVAVFGILSGFNQLQFSRLRELRLLRGVGMSSRQLLMLLAGQSTALALLALPFALTLALFMNWMLCQRVNPLAFGFSIRFGVDWGLVLLFASLGVLVVVLAALVPWRMTREASHVATTDETF